MALLRPSVRGSAVRSLELIAELDLLAVLVEQVLGHEHGGGLAIAAAVRAEQIQEQQRRHGVLWQQLDLLRRAVQVSNGANVGMGAREVLHDNAAPLTSPGLHNHERPVEIRVRAKPRLLESWSHTPSSRGTN